MFYGAIWYIQLFQQTKDLKYLEQLYQSGILENPKDSYCRLLAYFITGCYEQENDSRIYIKGNYTYSARRSDHIRDHLAEISKEYSKIEQDPNYYYIAKCKIKS